MTIIIALAIAQAGNPGNNNNKGLKFKHGTPFTDCISEMNYT